MKTITKADARALKANYALRYQLFYMFGTVLLAVFIIYPAFVFGDSNTSFDFGLFQYIESLKINKDVKLVIGLGLPGFLAFLLMFSLYKYKQNKLVRTANNAITKNIKLLSNSLENADFIGVYCSGGVAIDIDNKKIATLNRFGDKKSLPIVFSSDQVRGYYANKGNYNEIKVIGAGGVFQRDNLGEIARENMNSKIKGAATTGLHFELNDIDVQEAHAMIEFDDAEKWLLVLEKFFDGALEKKNQDGTPYLFPA